MSNLSTQIETYENVSILWKNQNEIEFNIDPYHNLLNNDYVTVSGLSTFIPKISKSHRIGVTTEKTSLLKEVPANAITGIVTDIYITRNLQTVSAGSTIGIGTEILSILNVFPNEKVLRVKRDVVGSAHTTSTSVFVKPDKFTIQANLDYFDSRVDDKVYFNPRNSVGVGSTSGIGIAVSFPLGEIVKTISVPTQSIYLPNHPFKTNQQVTISKKTSAAALSVGATSGGSPFTLPLSGDSQTVYVINKSKDFIGLTTSVGLTTNTDGLFFFNNGSDDYEYLIESNYNQITSKVEKIVTTVFVSTDHQLKVNDKVSLEIIPSKTVGVGNSTAVKVKYNTDIEKILVDPIGFSSSSVQTSSNRLSFWVSMD